MVGFEKNRFIGITESEKQDYSCSLCEAIFIDPRVMKCCQQTVCEQCIREWMTDNKTCRFCEQSLSYSSLSLAPVIITNHINGLKIKCMFAENGCGIVVKVEELAVHEIHCSFNPEKKCIDCKAVGNELHDCLSVLKFKFEKLEKEMEVIDSDFIEKRALKSARDSLTAGQEFIVEEEKNIPQEMKEQIKQIVSKGLLRISKGKENLICVKICNELQRLDEKKNWNLNFYFYDIGWEFRSNSSYTRSIALSIGSLKCHIFTIKK